MIIALRGWLHDMVFVERFFARHKNIAALFVVLPVIVLSVTVTTAIMGLSASECGFVSGLIGPTFTNVWLIHAKARGVGCFMLTLLFPPLPFLLRDKREVIL